jgi:hypothetical protein
MMTFAAFQPGTTLGRHHSVLSDEILEQWTALFPADRATMSTMPSAMTAMVLMRAFIEILNERPVGNIHASQKFWISRLPLIGESITTTLRCVSKEEKSGRRWVTFASDSTDRSEQLLFRGQMTTIWAA